MLKPGKHPIICTSTISELPESYTFKNNLMKWIMPDCILFLTHLGPGAS